MEHLHTTNILIEGWVATIDVYRRDGRYTVRFTYRGKVTLTTIG